VTFNPLNLALRHHFISYILLAVELSAILIQAIYFIIKPMNSISAGLRNTTPPADQRQHHPNRAFRSLFSLCEFGHIGDCPGDEFVEAASGQGDPLSSRACSSTRIGRKGPSDVSGRMMSRRRAEDGFRQSTRMTSDSASAVSFLRRISISI